MQNREGRLLQLHLNLATGLFKCLIFNTEKKNPNVCNTNTECPSEYIFQGKKKTNKIEQRYATYLFQNLN